MERLSASLAMAPLRWQCIPGCGACCRLDPELRPEAVEALSPEQRQRYLALVGPDGWCIHFDTGGRRCRIYAERPDFCRVENLLSLFGHEQTAEQGPDQTPDQTREGQASDARAGDAGACDAQANNTLANAALAVACCTQQIRGEYGGRSREMRRFQRALRP